jgi:iron complex outermembrane receptor protein
MIQTAHRFATRRRALFAGFALAALVAATPALAQVQHAIHIPAGPLDAALLALAEQSHEQLLFTPSLVAGRTSPAVDGDLTAEQALARLLGASGITVNRTGPSMLVLRPAPTRSLTPVAQRGGTAAPDAGPDRPFVTERQEAGTVTLSAQEAEAPGPPARAANTVEEVEVTGTHIHGGQTSSPMLVIDRTELERSGQTTVADALRALPENFGGGAGEGNTNAGGDKVGRNDTFSSGLNLRGLGNNATLVLINGRRMAGSGAFGDFTDLSMIPSAAVERVEVLLDGASAVYGSDAVGGVVNIITRKDFSGGELRVLGGVATAGEPGQAQVSQTFGKRWSSGDVVVAYEFQQRDALNGADRGFAASADLRPLGGTDQRQTNSFPGNILIADPVTRALAPAFAIPPGQNGTNLTPGAFVPGVVNRQNQRLGEDILPQQTLNSIYVSARQELGDRLQLSGDATYSYRRFKSHQPPATSTFSVTRGNPFFVSPVGAATDTVAYSFADDFPNPTTGGSVEDLALSFGGNLRLFGDWQAEAYATFAQAKADVRNNGLLNSLSLSEALGSVADRPDTPFSAARDGFFNPFSGVRGANNAVVVDYISGGFIDNRSRDQVSSINLQADGTLWTLPGGALKLAIGVQARRESLYQTGVTFVSTAAPVIKPPNELSRDVTAAFAELQAPLFGASNARPGLQKLEFSAAGRVEHYEGIGTTANPKFGVLWAPVEDLQLRATFGRSFRAPALRETSDAADYSPSLLNVGSTKVLSLILGGGNPNLRPETARSWTLGADFKPSRWPGLTIDVTAYDIRYHDRIDRPVQANLANALQDPTLASFVTRISPTSNPADLALITALLSSPALSTANGVFAPTTYGGIADNRYVNTSTLQVRGVDLTANYAFRVGDDDVSLTENASYLFDYDQKVTPTSPLLNRVNVVNFPLRFRSRATANWTRGRLTLTGAFNYAGAYRDALGVGIDAQPTFDAQARLAPSEAGLLRGVTVLLNIRNILNRDPPFYNNTAGVGYDPASGDPIGRFVSIQLTRAW